MSRETGEREDFQRLSSTKEQNAEPYIVIFNKMTAMFQYTPAFIKSYCCFTKFPILFSQELLSKLKFFHIYK